MTASALHFALWEYYLSPSNPPPSEMFSSPSALFSALHPMEFRDWVRPASAAPVSRILQRRSERWAARRSTRNSPAEAYKTIRRSELGISATSESNRVVWGWGAAT